MSSDPYFTFTGMDSLDPPMMDSLSPDSLLPPLVVRNKRGRKVDETLPKSHQREVQRQFRARRAGHLLDLERRVSLLERENLILRHWAGVLPASRYLLGRGPTGCDTTKPLIADDNDPEIQLVTDESSPRDRSWPPASAVPPARAPYQEHADGADSINTSQGAQPTTAQQSMIPNSPIAPTAAPVFEKQGFESPYGDTRKYKPHPLYDQRSIFGDYPAHVSNFDPVPALAVDRLLVKRESVYAPPTAMSSLLPHAQRTDIPSHDSAVYYPTQSRPSYSRPVESFTSQSMNSAHADMNGSNATINANYPSMYPQHLVSWADQYSNTTPASQTVNRRQPPSTLTPLTPVIPPVGLTSGSVSTTSPSSQPASASGSVPDQRPPTNPAEPMYAPRRSVTYGFTSSSTPTSLSSSSYLQSSAQGQSTMYTHHADGAQQQSQQQQQLHLHQQQQRQRQYHDGNVTSDSFRQ